MKSKLFIFFLLFTGTISNAGYAQMTVTVLVPVINIPMNTASHYANGNSVTVSNAILVASSVIWDLSVKTTGNFINGANFIDPSSFGLDVTNPIGTQQPERLLAVSNQFVVSAAPANLLSPVNLNIVFRAIGGSTFLNKAPGAYSTTLVYTITAN